jgi:hypothetical protein
LGVLDVTERQASGEPPERAARAEAVCAEMRERMARALGDDAHLHLTTVIMLAGDVLGSSAGSSGDLEAGVQALAQGSRTRGLTRMVRVRLEKMQDHEDEERSVTHAG